MNASKFLVYVERVVMNDKLSAHKGPGIREAIETRGATLCYLPPYSPDLNPIEMPFQQAEGISEQGGRTNNFPPASPNWHIRAQSKRPRSLQLFQARRLCVKSTGICSSSAPVGMCQGSRTESEASFS
jgi:DDE superfamily endonuclease